MAMYVTTYLILPLALVIVVGWWLRSNNKRNYYKDIPTPPTIPFFGNVFDFFSTATVLGAFSTYLKEYGGLVKLKIGPIKNILLVDDYKMLELVLSSTTLLKKSENYQYLNSWLGGGLLIGSGERWKKHRKMLAPAFHFKILEEFVETFETCGDILIQKLAKETNKDSVDIYPFVTLCTLDVICETTMGTKINAQDDLTSEYVHSVKEMCRIIIERSISPIQMYAFPFTRNYRIQKKAIRILHDKASKVIEKRIHELHGRPKTNDTEDSLINKRTKKAFLDLLLEAEVNGRLLTKEEIREEVDTFMFAGHDTTASAISFTLFCIANHPQVQQLIYEEQQVLFEQDNKPLVTYSHLQNMKYLEKVIKESLRLYPSVPFIGRQSDTDLEYGDVCIPKGDTLLLFLFGIHRNSKYYENPELFNPERFENLEGKLPYAYLPFSSGPRNCIGQKFAMLEMKSLVSKIIRKFELRPAIPKHNLQLVAETVLKSSNGIRIYLKSRS